MIGSRVGRVDIRRTADARTDTKPSMASRRCWSAACNPARLGPTIVATLLLFAAALQCIDLRAELLFRSAEKRNGQQHWSGLKDYASQANIASARSLAEGIKAPAEEVQVFLDGYITARDVSSARVLEHLLKNGKQKIAGNVVSFSSDGGEVDAALDLGRVLRRLGVSTLVARDHQCMSSCVFAFMGGDRRIVAGRLAIHRPYFSSTREVPDRRMQYRKMTKRLQEYIEELDFPPSLYEAVMAVPPEELSTVTPADLKRFYLEGMSPSTEEEVDAASALALGISVLDYLHQKAQMKSCADIHDANGPCKAAAAGYMARRQRTDTQRTDTQGDGASRNASGS